MLNTIVSGAQNLDGNNMSANMLRHWRIRRGKKVVGVQGLNLCPLACRAKPSIAIFLF